MGKNPYIDSVNLLAISNRRYGAGRKSCGVYNYELWEIETESGEKFYVTNQSKTVDFYCYQQCKKEKLEKFFDGNCDMNLKYGKK